MANKDRGNYTQNREGDKGKIEVRRNVKRFKPLILIIVMLSLPSDFMKEIRDEAERIKRYREYSTFTPPSIIISSSYPKATAYILFPLSNNKTVLERMENYHALANMRSYYDVVSLRMRTLGMKKYISLKKYYDNENIRLLGMSEKVGEVEGEIKKVYLPQRMIGRRYAPFIPLMNVNNIKYDNVKMNKYVEKVYYDTDWKAKEGLKYLYKKGIDEYDLSRYFSLGVMGTKLERRFVPTKWSITAVDDLLAKEMYREIRQYGDVNTTYYFTGKLFMNIYHIFLLPGAWGFELIEFCYMSGKINQDYEGFWGRKDYASETTGAYYAIRKEVLDYLIKIKKQAKVLVIREIEEGYRSLGVWVVREGVRKALSSKPLQDIDIREEIRRINSVLCSQMKRKIDLWRMSRLLRDTGQKKLF